MRALANLIHLLYPPACLICHALLSSPAADSNMTDSQVACEDCKKTSYRNGKPLCQRCGLELHGAFDALLVCESCREQPLSFEMARAPWQYAGAVQTAIHQFKYHRRWKLGRWLAQDMAQTALESLPIDKIDSIMPVPLHWIKQRIKGFNPAGELASDVARILRIPCTSKGLRKTRWTSTQTALTRRKRHINVLKAFTARPEIVKKRTILLVDDVLTSAATVNACSLALQEAGAARVFVITAARTPLAQL